MLNTNENYSVDMKSHLTMTLIGEAKYIDSDEGFSTLVSLMMKVW